MPEAPTFNTVRNGYDPAAVDAWVRQHLNDVDDLRRQLQDATHQVEELEQLRRQEDERVGAVMTRAQAAADLIMHEARMEADRLRNQAKDEAATIHAEELAAANHRLQDLSAQVDQTERYLNDLQMVIEQRIQAAREALQQAIDMLQVGPSDNLVEHQVTIDHPTPARPASLSDLVGGAEPEPHDEVLDVLGGANASA
jgi:ABC-type transporter Mla subunit MlaD